MRPAKNAPANYEPNATATHYPVSPIAKVDVTAGLNVHF